MTHHNLEAFNNIESPSCFDGLETEETYIKALMEKHTERVAFIELLVGGKPTRMIEYCSGSSSLLFALNARGLLSSSIGIEVSESRHKFAERWRERFGISPEVIKNVHGNVMDTFVVSPCADVALLVHSALSYFGPMDPSYPHTLLHTIRRSLVKGGKLIIEQETSRDLLVACSMEEIHKTWTVYDDWHPIQYILQAFMLEKPSTIHSNHVIIRRKDGGQMTRLISIQAFTPGEISDLLDASGFRMTGFYSGWKGEKAKDGDPIMVIVAEAV